MFLEVALLVLAICNCSIGAPDYAGGGKQQQRLLHDAGWADPLAAAEPSAGRKLTWFGGGGGSSAATLDFGLRRAPEVVALEDHLDSLTGLGICYHNTSILPEAPSGICAPLLCLYSDAARANIDMEQKPLTLSNSDRCEQPTGGQRPLRDGEQPTVSFIIPYLNHPEPTARCLLELFRTAREVDSAEFILVSDGSDEEELVLETAERLRQLFGARVIHHHFDVRHGFGLSVNQGGQLATGKFYAIINNDAYVVKGWLWALMSTFDQRNPRRTALVGPMFMGHHNLVQEGGGWMFSDATGGNYGKNKALTSEVNYLREVDYVSAAAVIVAADLQDPGHILDEAYENGYYEDTDLAFRMTKKGHRVLFQPLSVVYHQEGTTFGTDAADWKKQLMAKNRKVFIDKWMSTLEEQHCPPQTDWSTAVRRKAYPRILWVDDKIPEPDRDSGSIRTLNILRILVEMGFDVTYQAMNVILNRSEYYEPLLRYYGIDTPRILPPSMWSLIDGSGNCKYDVIVVARRDMYLSALPYLIQDCPCQPLVYDTVDLHFLREARGMITKNSKSDAWDFKGLSTEAICEWLDSGTPDAKGVARSREVELELMDKSDVVVVVSHVEAEVVKHFRPNAKVTVLSNTHDLGEELPPIPTNCAQRKGVMFIGSFNHPPNRQAIVTFVEELLPLVLRYLPEKHKADFMFNIIGSDDVPQDLVTMFERNKKYVKFHGYLPEEDVKEMFQSVKVFAAPLLAGAGVKGKVNQAMKYGLPVVGTPIAFEAMFPTDGEDCMVANTADDFARKIAEVYDDCALWARLVKGGYINVRKNFGLETARQRILETLQLVDIKPRTPGEASCEMEDE